MNLEAIGARFRRRPGQNLALAGVGFSVVPASFLSLPFHDLVCVPTPSITMDLTVYSWRTPDHIAVALIDALVEQARDYERNVKELMSGS